MLCQECHNANASVHVKRREGDEEVSVHLCRACAQKMGWNDPLEDAKFPLAQFISSMMQDMTSGVARERADEVDAKCSECGLSFQEFSRTGRLGCGHCYESFRASMQELLRRIHGNTTHEGRRPQHAPKQVKEPSQSATLKQLKTDLDRAISDEDFERAAKLRDEIREFKESQTSAAQEAAK
jgi:protein arginine kinase activator